MVLGEGRCRGAPWMLLYESAAAALPLSSHWALCHDLWQLPCALLLCVACTVSPICLSHMWKQDLGLGRPSEGCVCVYRCEGGAEAQMDLEEPVGGPLGMLVVRTKAVQGAPQFDGCPEHHHMFISGPLTASCTFC